MNTLIRGTDISQHALTVATCTFLGYIIGFFAQIIMAKYFGISKLMDIYIIASSIPTFIYGLLSGVSISALMIIFTKYKNQHGIDNSGIFASSIFNIGVLFFSVVSILMAVFSPLIIPLIAPGFLSENLKTAIKLSQLLSITILFLGLSDITATILYTKRCFAMPALSKAIISFSIIASAFFLKSKLGIFSLAVGSILGSFLALQSQALILIKKGARYSFILDFKNKILKQIVDLSRPLLLTGFLFYLNKLITQVIATTLPSGNVAALNYSFTLISIPVLVLAGSIATAIYPRITQCVTEGKNGELKFILQSAIRLTFFLLLPISLAAIILRNSLVKALFQRGMFDSRATELTASTLAFYAIGLVAYGLDPIFAKLFYSLERIKMRAILIFLLLLLNICLSLILAKFYHSNGLAIATSISYLALIIISFFALRKNFIDGKGWQLFWPLIKIVLVSAAMGGILIVSVNICEKNGISGIFALLALSFTGCASYFFFSKIIRIEELETIISMFKKAAYKYAPFLSKAIET